MNISERNCEYWRQATLLQKAIEWLKEGKDIIIEYKEEEFASLIRASETLESNCESFFYQWSEQPGKVLDQRELVEELAKSIMVYNGKPSVDQKTIK